MSKKKPLKIDDQAVSAESVDRFAEEVADYAKRLKQVVSKMRSLGFSSIQRSSKRNHSILKAIGQFTRGLEGALERMQEDIDASTATQLRVADSSTPFESASEKTDKK